MSGIGEFRKAMFGGFNEEDVMQYIKQMNYDAKVTEDELHQTIEDLNAEKEDLSKEVATQNKRIEGLNKQVSDLKKDITDYEEEINSLKNSIEEIKSLISQKDVEIQDKITLNEKFKRVLEEKDIIIENVNNKLDKVIQENVRLESKVQLNEESYKRYNEINSHFGEILTQAHTRAERILDDATAEMEEITNASVNTVNFFTENFLNLKTDIVKFEKMMTSSANMLEERLVQLSVGMEEALDILEQKKKDFDERRNSEEDTQITIDMSVLDEIEDVEGSAGPGFDY